MLAASLLDTMPQCRQTEEAFCLCIEQVFEDGGFVLRRDVPGIGVTYQDHCHGSTNKSKHLTWVAVISMSPPFPGLVFQQLQGLLRKSKVAR